MDRTLEDLLSENQEFLQLKQKSRIAKTPAAGLASYLISKLWLRKYKLYVFTKEVKRHIKPQMKADHCTVFYPGPISNEEDLCVKDPEHKNLKGTGTLEQFESSHVDVYLEKLIREGYQYNVIN